MFSSAQCTREGGNGGREDGSVVKELIKQGRGPEFGFSDPREMPGESGDPYIIPASWVETGDFPT